MALYRISGVWQDANKVITHYAFHIQGENSISRAIRTSQAQAVELLETAGNSATTLIWNYSQAKWNIGEPVRVVSGSEGKFLRSNTDNKLGDHLHHLINFDWISSNEYSATF